MSFLLYDLILLGLFLIFFSFFLYTRKKNIKKEGLFFLYKSNWGIKLINYLGTKHKKTVKVLEYISVFVGYLLMIGALYLIYGIVKIYIFNPLIVKAIKVPPILPLFPYVPQVFNLNFLPPFYFTYWIIIIAVIAITHEMAHGIFAAYNKVKIKKTGFGFFPYFLPILLAAFVELDEKVMQKKKKFQQLAILSAGTFANIITAIIFLFLLMGFFSLAFAPSGIIFDSYATSVVVVSGISMINGVNLNNASYDRILNISSAEGLNNLTFENNTYFATKSMLEDQKSNNQGVIVVYSNAPAIRANLSSIITEINGVQINSIDKLQRELNKYKPGDNITITEKTGTGFSNKMITLEERPNQPEVAWLGIGFFNKQPSGFVGNLVSSLSSFKSSNVYYASKFSDIGIFIYNLLWWIVIISLTVAFMNMLPVGIFDGGRFFYLTILGITKNEKIAGRAFKFSTYLFLFILVLIMVLWFIQF